MQCAEREGGWRPHLRMHGLRKCIQPAAPTLPFDGFVHLQENAHPGLRRQHSLSPVIIGRRQFIASHNWSNTFIMSHNWSTTVYHDSLLVKHSLSWLRIGQRQFTMTQNWSKRVYYDTELVNKQFLKTQSWSKKSWSINNVSTLWNNFKSKSAEPLESLKIS